MALDPENTLFATGYNYQKVALKNSGTVVVPNNTPNFDTNTITHSLGYIPSVRVWYDPGNGRRFPISEEEYTDDTSFTSETNQVVARAYLTTTTLVIQFKNASGSNKTVNYWYKVYYDT
jgi:hypothetical protein